LFAENATQRRLLLIQPIGPTSLHLAMEISMKALLATLVPITLALSLFAAVGLAQDKSTKAVDPSGTWRWEYDFGGETMKDSLRLNLGKDKKLAGHYKGREDKWIEIKDAKVEGDSLSFLLPLDFQGTPLKLEFAGKVKGDEIEGNVKVSTGEGAQEFPWAPKRSVLIEDVVGEWQMKIEAGDRTLEPVVTITKDGEKYKGKYVSGQEFSAELSDLKVENNQLIFNVAGEVNGTKIKADYKGRPYGDKIQGSIAYVLGDNSGDIEFTGTRKPVDSKP